MSSADFVPIIPRRELFGDPEKASPELSPDGARLAYLAPDEGVLNVWMRTLGQSDDRPITHDRGRGIHYYFWSWDSGYILYLQDKDGDENWHIHSVDLANGETRDLIPFEGAQAQVIGLSDRAPNTVLLGINHREPRLHDVYALDLPSGGLTMVEENPGDAIGWIADANLNVLGTAAPTAEGGFTLRVRESAGAAWRTLIVWSPEDEGNAYGFTADGCGLYIGDSRGTDTIELRLTDSVSGEQTVLASNSEADLSDVVIHPTEHHVQAAGFNKTRHEWTVLDPGVAVDFERLSEFLSGEFHIESRDAADRIWIVTYTQDTKSPAYYVYDRKSGEISFLFSRRSILDNYTFAECRPVDIISRDGLTLHCYLTLPRGPEPKNLPLVLNVHGGPWGRDSWGFDLESQWLANRGYASLQVNFRGSTGFGKKFVHAGDKEWGGKMHDDLIDAVNWAIGEGIADPKRVGIFGGSYGGYAALVGAAFTPEIFACSVDLVGPSNLKTFLSSVPPYWEPLKKLLAARVGDLETEEEFLESRSPLYKVDQIRCPMLIAQGANDPRVKQAESEQIVVALRERGKPVEYMLFEDEGHGLARPENRLEFYAAAEEFLARYLGGRAE